MSIYTGALQFQKLQLWIHVHTKNWCFWTVMLEKTLENPLTARRSNQSVLKGISPEYSLEGLMLKLKLQYFDHLMQRTDSLEKTLMLGKIKGRKRRGWQRMRWLDGITSSMDEFEQALGVGDGQGGLAAGVLGSQSRAQPSDWADWWTHGDCLPVSESWLPVPGRENLTDLARVKCPHMSHSATSRRTNLTV